MSKFNIGDRVITIQNGKIRKGVVHKIYDDIPIMFVMFESGYIEKVDIDNVALEPKSEVEAPEKKSAPVEKAEITITPDEFRNLAVRMAISESCGNVMLSLAYTRFAAHLHDALFMAEADNA